MGITLLDGGMGQELVRRSPDPVTPLWGATVLRDHPDLVRDLHAEFIAAGAQVITVNSYAATRLRLMRHGGVESFEEFQRSAVNLAKEAVNASGRAVQVAGCLPPLNFSYDYDSVPEIDQAAELFAETIALQSFGADLFIAETMSSIKEVQGVIAGSKDAGKPIWIACTTKDEDGLHLRSGEPLAHAVDLIDAADHVSAVLVNCSRPEAVTASMPVLANGTKPFGAYANGFSKIAGTYKPGSTVAELETREDLGPLAYADFADQWVAAGATIIGGCCEVGPAHIAEIAARHLAVSA